MARISDLLVVMLCHSQFVFFLQLLVAEQTFRGARAVGHELATLAAGEAGRDVVANGHGRLQGGPCLRSCMPLQSSKAVIPGHRIFVGASLLPRLDRMGE